MNSFLINLIQILAIIVSGYVGGELIAKLKLPRVLGYIIVGMIIGPYALGLINVELAQTAIFTLALVIAVGFVGLSVGSGINLEEIREGGTKILVIGLFATALPFALVALAMYHLFNFDLYSSLIFGSIALATSPITALAIINEYRVEGPVKKTLMLLAAIDDAIAVVVFGVLIAMAGSFYGSGSAAWYEPFLELGLSAVVGLAFGYLGFLAIQKSIQKNIKKKGILVITVIFVLLMLVVANRVHAEAMLSGIVAGVIIYNLLEGKNKEKFEEATKLTISLSVLGVLVLVGATLDIHAVFSWFAIVGALIYVAMRALGTIGGASIGSKVTKAGRTVEKYLGLTLLAGAGVSLTFAGIAITVLPHEYGIKMGAIIAAAAIINEVIAVFTTKWAFKKAGEIGKAK